MSITNKQRFEILRRDAFTCQYCGKRAPTTKLEVDHIEPSSKGGTDDDGNLITSCFECNRGKIDKPIIEQDNRLSEADYIYRLIDFPAEINRSIEMLEKHLHGAIVKCLEGYPRHIVCMAIILERDNVFSDCDFVEYEDETDIISALDENCMILSEYWEEISPYKTIRLIEHVDSEARNETSYQFKSSYNLTAKTWRGTTDE